MILFIYNKLKAYQDIDSNLGRNLALRVGAPRPIGIARPIDRTISIFRPTFVIVTIFT